MGHRVSPEAEDDLSSAWRYIATESGSPEIADRLVDAIAERFLLLAKFPHFGRSLFLSRDSSATHAWVVWCSQVTDHNPFGPTAHRTREPTLDLAHDVSADVVGCRIASVLLLLVLCI
jgi:plasmid stabilization system protein ParE